MTSGVGGNFPVGLPVGEVVRVEGHILVQLYAQLDRMEYIRLVDYSLPGILMQDPRHRHREGRGWGFAWLGQVAPRAIAALRLT